jgi:hypothetical protein
MKLLEVNGASEKTKMILLQGETGVGKSVWLQRLCRNHHNDADEVFVYVNLDDFGSATLQSLSLEGVVATISHIKDVTKRKYIVDALERLHDRIVYCFDSSQAITKWDMSRLAWVSRCVMAMRPEQAFLLHFSLCNNKSQHVTCNMVELGGFVSESAQNLMRSLAWRSISKSFVMSADCSFWQRRELLDTAKGFATLVSQSCQSNSRGQTQMETT